MRLRSTKQLLSSIHPASRASRRRRRAVREVINKTQLDALTRKSGQSRREQNCGDGLQREAKSAHQS